MFREIKKKRLILENRKPYARETADYIREMNTTDWVYSSVRLDGLPISRENAGRIVRGEFVTGCTISEHVEVRNHCDAIKLAGEMAEMNADLSPGTVMTLYKTLTQAEMIYRRSNPVLRSIDYIPPHFNEIDEQMAILFQWTRENEALVDPIMKAALLHNKFIEIYPFEDHAESMARLVMQYELIRNGFPPVLLLMSEQEYNQAIIAYLKTENSAALYEALLRGVFNKLEVFMQLTS